MKNTFGVARSEESIRAQPDFKFYPKSVQEQWLNFYKKNRFLNQISLEKRARWVEIRNKLIKAIYDAGGKIMAGSDSPEFLFLYGFSQHRELKALPMPDFQTTPRSKPERKIRQCFSALWIKSEQSKKANAPI